MRATRERLPEGRATTGSPGCTTPLAMVPQKPRKSGFGRLTYCTGRRNSSKLRSAATGRVSRMCIIVGPSYQGMAVEGFTTLSPCKAETGT